MGWVMAILPLGLLVLGFPIFIVLLATAVVLIVGFTNMPLAMAAQIMFGSLDKFVLLAVPFFIFAGELMSRGGISERIVNWVLAMLGGVRGSLGYTTVATCEFFGTMSGSSPATVAAVGRLLYPSLRAHGYDARFAVGIVTSSGAIAAIIPPSLVMILYGIAAEQSIAALFLGGFLPGIMIGLMVAGWVYVYARRNGIREGGAFSLAAIGRATRAGAWALGTPVVILGGIYAGVFSPTEAAGVAGIYALIVTLFVYREIDWRGVLDVAANSVVLTAQVMVIVAAAGVFSWLLTVSGVPQAIVAFIQGLNAEAWMVLLVVNVFLLIVGCLIDPASALLILTPLLAPVVKAVGVDLVHFGIIMTVNLSIGMFTPPFGLNIFVSQSLFDVPLKDIYRGLVPFIAINVAALAIITYVPWLSLWLPSLAR
ncbi:MAG: TRAP transporter large permease [Alphaproteobacteria bacterium]|nr:TRAP transporter large permease [Alphaproteobacteria bacterium]